MPGMRLSEAATSSRKIDGTISETGMTSEMAVMPSSEKPKLKKPPTIAASRIAGLLSTRPGKCCGRPQKKSANMIPPEKAARQFRGGWRGHPTYFDRARQLDAQ